MQCLIAYSTPCSTLNQLHSPSVPCDFTEAQNLRKQTQIKPSHSSRLVFVFIVRLVLFIVTNDSA